MRSQLKAQVKMKHFVFKIGNKEGPVYPANVDSTPINMLIDSGSTLNIMDEVSLQKLKEKLQLSVRQQSKDIHLLK